MPLNLSFTHIMVVAVVALIVLGPEKLPGAARTLTRLIHEIRNLTTGLGDEVRETFGEFVEPIGELVNAVSGGVGGLVRETVGSVVAPPGRTDGGRAGASSGDAEAGQAGVPVRPGTTGRPAPVPVPVPAIPLLAPAPGPMALAPTIALLPALGAEPAPGTFVRAPAELVPAPPQR